MGTLRAGCNEKSECRKTRQETMKRGQVFNPIVIEGKKIASTFWGKAWCDHLESYSDFENRLPRGRTYVRNGSVIDLQVSKGRIDAKVMGSSLYEITIQIQTMLEKKWKTIVNACSGKIDSLIELLQGKFSKGVMAIITEKEAGLFPKPQEIEMSCSCPDYAGMCKHIAAVLYGIGAALDTKPEWLFTLRNVDQLELIASAGKGGALTATSSQDALPESDLAALFGIEMDGHASPSLPMDQSKPTTPAVKAKKKKSEPVKAVKGKAKKVGAKPKKKRDSNNITIYNIWRLILHEIRKIVFKDWPE